MKIGLYENWCSVEVRRGCKGVQLQKLRKSAKSKIRSTINSACYGVNYRCCSDAARSQFAV